MKGFKKNVTKKCSPKVIMLTNEKKNLMIVDIEIEIDFESQILALSCLFTKYKNLQLSGT